MYIRFFICLHFGVEGLRIYSVSFRVASEGSLRNAFTFTVDFADFLKKAIVLAGGHALQPSTLRKLLVHFCDLGCLTHISTWRETTQRMDDDFGIPTRQSHGHLLTNLFKEEDNFDNNEKGWGGGGVGGVSSNISFNFM